MFFYDDGNKLGSSRVLLKVADRHDSFGDTLLPHIDAAYNLARWLARDASDAEDIVQEAYVRALKYRGTFSGGDVKSWMLRIVRNTCYTFLHKESRVDRI
jgi:DNA-directed RNA polymerase specialized sigma subunit, sigma24 homolog